METSTIYKKFIFLIQNDLKIEENTAKKFFSQNIISEHLVTLPQNILKQAQKFIEIFYNFKKNPEYKKLANISDYSFPDTPSVLSSFDFHLNLDNTLKLIEVNTNASMSLILSYLFAAHDKQDISEKINLNILSSFNNTYKKTLNKELKSIVIIDDQPENQKMLGEFYLFKHLFTSNDIACEIEDSCNIEFSNSDQNLALKIKNKNFYTDFIYNRDTDFFLERPAVSELLQAYKNNTICLSPNPYEYKLQADKENLVNISAFGHNFIKEDQLKFIKTHLPNTFITTTVDADLLWSQKSKYFFKPKNSFGSKAVYKGKSLTKNKFSEVYNNNFIAQEWIKPGTIQIDPENTNQTYKFDLRFYTFEGKIQAVGARLYQGQLTNFKNIGGGLAPVIFS